MIYSNRKKGEIAKKKYGQNFLKDESVIYKIIESMPKSDERVVEIGPGLGDLTGYLVENKDVTAYEVDRDLCEHLRTRFAEAVETGRLKLRCGDVLAYWERGRLEERPYHLVANLPYYIATNIVLRALKDPNCKSLLVMVQKEVAEKFSANVGEKTFSSLSVLARSAGEVSSVFDVPPEAFVPAPKVMSSVLRITKRRTLHDTAFETFLKTAFTQPRKTLRGNLSKRFDKKEVTAAFEALELSPSIRPHEVDTSLYHRLYKILTEGDVDGRKKTPRGKRQLPEQTERSKQ
ncbi:16S rRNA (adenine(1518)-N(6)/adenine(1519)-N(6))-dimethyltransferase RsmA [Hydrogenimonas sp.]